MKKLKARTLRTIVTFAVLVLVAVGYFTAWGIGNVSGFGWDAFSVLCPLGYLESLVAGKTFVPRAFLSFVLVVILIVLLGRVFCAWICPMPTLQRLIPGVRGREQRRSKRVGRPQNQECEQVSEESCQNLRSCVQESANDSIKMDKSVESVAQLDKKTPRRMSETGLPTVLAHTDEKFGMSRAKEGQNKGDASASVTGAPKMRLRRVRFDSRFGVLLGALASAALFGFPVFCLICPVGLTFATVLLVMRLFAFGDVTWAVVVVPLVLFAEVVFLRKWCGKFCPLGALISLVSGANRTLRPHVDNASCLFSSKGTHCFACSKACPEHIDVRRPELSEGALANCTKCRECADACPAHAITFPALPKAETPVVQGKPANGEGSDD